MCLFLHTQRRPQRPAVQCRGLEAGSRAGARTTREASAGGEASVQPRKRGWKVGAGPWAPAGPFPRKMLGTQARGARSGGGRPLWARFGLSREGLFNFALQEYFLLLSLLLLPQHTHTHTQADTHTCTHTEADTHTCTHTEAEAHVHTHVHTHRQRHTHTCTHTSLC